MGRRVLKFDGPLAPRVVVAASPQIIKKAGPHPPVISTVAERSGEISLSDGTGGITVGDLSAQSIMGAVPICLPYRHAAPLEMTVTAGTIGHTFGVKVQRVQRGRFLRLTGPWPEGS